jgi:hypothetical protein
MIQLTVLECPDPDWNGRILGSTLGTFYQTAEYANYYNIHTGSKAQFLLFKNNNEVVAQHLIFLKPRGTTSIKKFLGKFVEPIYFWNNSILIFRDNLKNEIIQSFVSFIKNKKYVGFDSPLANFKLDLPSTKVGTVILELKHTFEETISQRDPTSTQKHIALAGSLGISTKKGVTVKQIETKEDIKIYFELLNSHRKDLRIGERSFDNVNDLISILRKGFGGGILAYHNNKPISGICYSIYNNWMHNMGVANTTYSVENKLSSLDYLRCYLISFGIKSRVKFFDLGGISLKPKNQKEIGIRHSQTKWGGKIVSYHRYSNT